MEQNGWIALGAASALGLGLLAGGAVTAATAMPLVDTSTSVDIAGISDVRADAKYFAGADQARTRGSSPAPSSSPSASPTASAPTASPAEPTPGPTVTQAPVPQPAPAAPIPVDSPPSPASLDDDSSSDD